MKKYIALIFFLFFNVCLISAFQFESSIVKIDGSDIYINWGSNEGIAPGDMFNAYRRTQMAHPTTDEGMEIEKDLVGKIMVTDIFPEYSIGKFISKRKEPGVGDYLELVIDYGNKNVILQKKEGSIISIDGGKVEINVGSEDGIGEGLFYNVMRREVLIHPITGENLDEKNILVGKIVVESVKHASSIADIINGWEDIKIGDIIVLSEAQKSDIDVDILKRERRQAIPPERESAEMELENLLMADMNQSKSSLLGEILKVDNKAKTAVFSWEEGVNKNSVTAGSKFGIYRTDRIIHPITKVELGAPDVLVGEGSFMRAAGENGVLKILNAGAKISNGDVVKLKDEGMHEVSGQRRTADQQIGKRINLKKEAEILTEEIIQIKEELSGLKTFSGRISNIEKSLNSQKRITNKLRKDIEDIKGKLDIIIEGGGGALIPSQTTMELYGAHPEKAKSFRIKYSDDIEVKFQFQGKTLLVSMDVDSEKVKDKVAAVEHIETPEIEEEIEEKKEIIESETKEDEEAVKLSELLGEVPEQEKPFYTKYLYHILGSIGGLILLFLILSFLKKRGGKKKPEETVDEFEDAEDEMEEVEEVEESEEAEEAEEVEEVEEENEEL